MSAGRVGDSRQRRLLRINDAATNAVLGMWSKMEFDRLDVSWNRVSPQIVERTNKAQYAAAVGSDRYVGALSKQYNFDQARSTIEPLAFVGVDGSGRSTEGLLRGSVTTTKEAVGAGLGRVRAMEAGAAYLAMMMKTGLADAARSADMVASVGKGYTLYARVVEFDACNRCVVLAGATQFKPFLRHPACRCTVQAIPSRADAQSPAEVFENMPESAQDKAFGKAGAQAIREGADVGQVVSARRGASGIGYSNRPTTRAGWNRMQKTTIGYRPDGTPVRVYSTVEGTTKRGVFGRAQSSFERVGDARYSTSKRVRLMPESIMEFAGDNAELRAAFLRDAGYLTYVPPGGYDSANRWIGEVAELRRADRILVDRATLRYGNFTLGG